MIANKIYNLYRVTQKRLTDRKDFAGEFHARLFV